MQCLFHAGVMPCIDLLNAPEMDLALAFLIPALGEAMPLDFDLARTERDGSTRLKDDDDELYVIGMARGK